MCFYTWGTNPYTAEMGIIYEDCVINVILRVGCATGLSVAAIFETLKASSPECRFILARVKNAVQKLTTDGYIEAHGPDTQSHVVTSSGREAFSHCVPQCEKVGPSSNTPRTALMAPTTITPTQAR